MAWVNTKCFHCVPLIWLLGRVAGLLIQATECRSGTAHAHTHFRSIGWCLRPHVIVQPSLPVQLLGYPDGTQWINARLVDYLSINKHLRGTAERGYLRTLPLGSSADDTAATCVVAVSLLVGIVTPGMSTSWDHQLIGDVRFLSAISGHVKTISVSERRRYICNVFSYWLRSFSRDLGR